MTVNNIAEHLQLINTKSQQLLKRLEYNVDSDENLDIEEVSQLEADRKQLITRLFNQFSNDEIQCELLLINKMTELDINLKIKIEKLKQNIAKKLITIKKGKKSALTYKKY